MAEIEKTIKNELTTNAVQTICGICSADCGMRLTVNENTIFSIRGQDENPESKGYLCSKGRALKEIVEAPDRLRHPLRKTKEGWKAITWDEAIDLVAQQLTQLKDKYGAETVAIHVGQAGVKKEFTWYTERFCSVFGTPNFSTAGSHCHISKMMGNILTYGGLPVPDYENGSCIALWGYNPSISCPPLMNLIKKALDGNAKLIVVDPYVTTLAKKADIHLQLRPGTDGALALAMLNVVVSENLYDKKFVEKWTIGFEKLVEHIKDYTPEKIEKISWVPAESIREAARLYATSTPACSYQGIALELQTNGAQAVRAISILQAITGNLDIKGGSIFSPMPKLSPLSLEYKERKPAVGQEKFPIFYRFTRQAQANLYAKAILDEEPYPLKGMVLTGTNAVITWPNSGKVKRALASLAFLAVMDHFMTETAKLADLVLPAATILERNEIWEHSSIYGSPRLGLAKKVLRNEECLTDWEFWSALAKRMGYKDYFPWENELEAINFRLKPLGLSAEKLGKKSLGYIFADREEKKYERDGFRTPSGKVEIYSQELENFGYDPLPNFNEPVESPLSTPELAEKYPLILSSGARMPGYLHSRFRNIPSLRKLNPFPYIEINKDKAAELGLEENEVVLVESPRGSVELKVKFSEGINPKVTRISHGWEEENVNLLVGDEILDPISGFPSARSLLIRVSRKR